MKKDNFDNIGWTLIMFITWIGVVITPLIGAGMIIGGVSLAGDQGLLVLLGGLLYMSLWPVAVVQLRVTRFLRTQMNMD